MTETTIATERLFDQNGQLVVPSGQPIPDGATDLRTHSEVSAPADPAYPAGKNDAGTRDTINDPVHDAVTTVPLYTPAEQALVDQGVMAPRESGGLSLGQAATASPAPVETPAVDVPTADPATGPEA
jgi:hypothetical protein